MEEDYFRLSVTIRSPKTRLQYGLAMNEFAAVLGREPVIGDLTDDNIAALMHEMIDRGLAPKTVNERRGRIHSLWTWLVRRGVVHHLPTTPRVDEPVRIPMAWTRHELNRLYASCAAQSGTIAGIPAGQWWMSLHLVCWDTGERIGALWQLTWDCVDLIDRWVKIPAELRKAKHADMTYRISREAVKLLRSIRTPDRRLIWPWPYSRAYIWTRYAKILKQAGLPTDRRSKFHRMRRSVASHYEAAGGNATALLGHTSRRVTESYLDPRIVKTTQPCDVLFRLSEPSEDDK